MLGDKVVLYNASTSPYGHRRLIALKRVGVEYKSVTVDMEDRDWKVVMKKHLAYNASYNIL